ncbi:putative Serine/threonine-protein kinase CTR1 [Monocercomonoides exilis]|uniref:putative Serine/threonine-protein kinase CTR1 n=1 Tax=Monocercomonoides exilis TaxID=2049356 RepID=UPI00355A082E|nr:putative Serine/threonine-protein kinase CTR1 [Monocercomonoides exilis]
MCFKIAHLISLVLDILSSNDYHSFKLSHLLSDRRLLMHLIDSITYLLTLVFLVFFSVIFSSLTLREPQQRWQEISVIASFFFLFIVVLAFNKQIITIKFTVIWIILLFFFFACQATMSVFVFTSLSPFSVIVDEGAAQSLTTAEELNPLIHSIPDCPSCISNFISNVQQPFGFENKTLESLSSYAFLPLSSPADMMQALSSTLAQSFPTDEQKRLFSFLSLLLPAVIMNYLALIALVIGILFARFNIAVSLNGDEFLQFFDFDEEKGINLTTASLSKYDLYFERKIGSGSFGDVFLGSYRRVPVAIKAFQIHTTLGESLLSEGDQFQLPSSTLPSFFTGEPLSSTEDVKERTHSSNFTQRSTSLHSTTESQLSEEAAVLSSEGVRSPEKYNSPSVVACQSPSLFSRSLFYTHSISPLRHRRLHHGSAAERSAARKALRTAVSKFYNEISILSSLHHPNIVQFIGAIVDPPDILLVEEYMNGGTLDTLLQSSRPLSFALRLRLALSAALPLLFLHEHSPPIIHRDVKTANFLVDTNLNVKLCDFGLSHICVEGGKSGGGRGRSGRSGSKRDREKEKEKEKRRRRREREREKVRLRRMNGEQGKSGKSGKSEKREKRGKRSVLRMREMMEKEEGQERQRRRWQVEKGRENEMRRKGGKGGKGGKGRKGMRGMKRGKGFGGEDGFPTPLLQKRDEFDEFRSGKEEEEEEEEEEEDGEGETETDADREMEGNTDASIDYDTAIHTDEEFDDVRSIHSLIEGGKTRKKSKRSTHEFRDVACGTTIWAAPEVFLHSTFSEKSDVYSFGLVLWEIFTRRRLFEGMNEVAVAVQVVQSNLRPRIPSNLPHPLRSLLTSCWDSTPSQRPSFDIICDSLQSMIDCFGSTDNED